MWRKAWFHWVVLAVIVIVFYVWEPWREARAGVADGVSPVSVVGNVEAEPVEASQDVFVCPCGGPGWCVGPRGGVYCIDIYGKKKYRPK